MIYTDIDTIAVMCM